MNKKEYITQLKRALFWRFKQSEVRDIISDYEEYFEIGLSQGQTEQEICKSLGSPMEAVRTITQRKISLAPLATLLRLTILGFIFIGLPLYILYINFSGNALSEGIIFTILIPTMLYIGLGGRINEIGKQKTSKNSKALRYITVSFCIATICFIAYFRSMLLGILNYNDMPFGLLPSEVGPFVSKFFITYNIIAIFIIIAFVFLELKNSLACFSVAYILIGCIASVANLKNVLFTIHDIALVPKATLTCFLPLIIGTIITLILYAVGNITKKRVIANECSN